MNPSPWSALAAAITRLSDRVDAQPTFREATVTSVTPVIMVHFDTDVASTMVQGNLAEELTVGARVMTLKLRHYVWIIGQKSTGVISQPVLGFAEDDAAWAIPSSTGIGPLGTTAEIGQGVSFATNIFTVGESGWYDVRGQLQVSPGAAGLGSGIVLTFLQQNGTLIQMSNRREWPQTNNDYVQTSEATVHAAAGDQFRLAAVRAVALTGASSSRRSLRVQKISD